MGALYDTIGQGYDTTRKADPYLLGRLRELLGLRPGARYVDVARGTGNYTAALAASGGRITGIDISERMLGAARAKAPGAVDWVRADVSKTPFGPGLFAGAVCTLAIHHFADLTAAFREVGRIVDRERGRFVLFTSTRAQTGRYWLKRYFPGMVARSARQMPALDRVTEALKAAGFPKLVFEPYSVSATLQDMFLYSAKHRPRLYLDAGFRAGISSFAKLCPPGELKSGLAALSRDIGNGAIAGVIEAADSDGGDYLFIRASR